jgi:DNA-binding protein HU-beta
MQKKDFISKVDEVLKNNDLKKKVSVPDTFFYIMDDFGNKKKLSVKVPDRLVSYNRADVQNVVDACLAVIEDCIRRGEELTFFGIGTFSLKWRAPRMTKAPLTDDWYSVPGHYVPSFKCGSILNTAAKLYEQSLKEKELNVPEPIYDIGDRELDFETMYGDCYEEEGDEDG